MKRENKIQQTLFGKEYINIDTIILTPIQPIFNEFILYFNEKNTGWWHTGIIDIQLDTDSNNIDTHKKILVIKSPIGTHIEDAVYYSPEAKNIFLLGYCGSYNKKLGVGELFSCTQALNNTNSIQASTILPSISSGMIYLVENFHQQEEALFKKELILRNIDCVDMETYSVFQSSLNKKQKIIPAFGAAHIITDTETKPFYELEHKDLALIAVQTKQLVQKTIDYFKK